MAEISADQIDEGNDEKLRVPMFAGPHQYKYSSKFDIYTSETGPSAIIDRMWKFTTSIHFLTFVKGSA
jgi:hypothetical protein